MLIDGSCENFTTMYAANDDTLLTQSEAIYRFLLFKLGTNEDISQEMKTNIEHFFTL